MSVTPIKLRGCPKENEERRQDQSRHQADKNHDLKALFSPITSAGLKPRRWN
jgi:hypothetical protein